MIPDLHNAERARRVLRRQRSTRECFGGMSWQGAIAAAAAGGLPPVTSPTDAAAGCVWWVEADQEVFEDTADPAEDADTVRIWGDLVGSNDLANATAGTRPTYATNALSSGKAGVIGASGKLLENSTNLATTYTFVICGKLNTTSNTDAIRWHNGTQYVLLRLHDAGNGKPSLFTGSHRLFPSALSAGDKFVATVTRTGNDYTADINGPTNAITPLTVATATHFAPREVFSGAFGFFDGAIYGMALYDSVLDATYRSRARTYWATEYGITLA